MVAALSNADQAKLELRSEEHTSELQSLMRISYAVFCLNKKKNKTEKKLKKKSQYEIEYIDKATPTNKLKCTLTINTTNKKEKTNKTTIRHSAIPKNHRGNKRI